MNIVQFGERYSKRDTWKTSKGEDTLVEDMEPAHCFFTVRRLRRTAEAEHAEDVARFRNVDEWLSCRVLAYDALLKKFNNPETQAALEAQREAINRTLDNQHRRDRRARRQREFEQQFMDDLFDIADLWGDNKI